MIEKSYGEISDEKEMVSKLEGLEMELRGREKEIVKEAKDLLIKKIEEEEWLRKVIEKLEERTNIEIVTDFGVVKVVENHNEENPGLYVDMVVGEDSEEEIATITYNREKMELNVYVKEEGKEDHSTRIVWNKNHLTKIFEAKNE